MNLDPTIYDRSSLKYTPTHARKVTRNANSADAMTCSRI